MVTILSFLQSEVFLLTEDSSLKKKKNPSYIQGHYWMGFVSTHLFMVRHLFSLHVPFSMPSVLLRDLVNCKPDQQHIGSQILSYWKISFSFTSALYSLHWWWTESSAWEIKLPIILPNLNNEKKKTFYLFIVNKVITFCYGSQKQEKQ